MTNCKEFVHDDVMAIAAIPIADFDIGTAAWQLKPTVTQDDISSCFLSAERIITIGPTRAFSVGVLIPIKKNTGKVKDAESDSTAGRMHSVTVSCDIDDRNSEVWGYLRVLERTPAHLLLLYRNITYGFVAATADTYKCEVERDGDKTSVSFIIQNLMGLQTVVSE